MPSSSTPPPEASDQSGSINENLPADTVVGKVEASDPDGDPLTFSIKDMNVPFEIDNNGRITTTEEFDYEAEGQQTEWTLTIEIDDNKGGVTTIKYTVDLNDIPQNVSNLSIDDINPPNGGAMFLKSEPIPIKFQFNIGPDDTPDLDAIAKDILLSPTVTDALIIPTVTSNDIIYNSNTGIATVNISASNNAPGPGPITDVAVECNINGQSVTSNTFWLSPLG